MLLRESTTKSLTFPPLHYLGNTNPQNCVFLLKCFSNKRRNTVKLSVSYRWTRLHYSLFSNSVKCYLSNSVIKHAMHTSFLSATSASAHKAFCVQHSSSTTVQNFISSTAMALPAQIWTQMLPAQDLWSHTASWIRDASQKYWKNIERNIEEIKQQVAELRQTVNTTFERRDFPVSVLSRWSRDTS